MNKVNVISMQITHFRTFGWVQDPSNLRSLCDVVAIFDPDSPKHRQLVNTIIPRLVRKSDGRVALIEAMNASPLKLKYSLLVGTSFIPRKSARCNGIIQATVPGQGRPFISDWPSDNFLRWAHAMGFVKYDYNDDTFELSSAGAALTSARTKGEGINNNEKEILITAMLAYPPAVRILNLLSETEGAHLTKFELGRQLGFVGEDGFTSIGQTTLIKTLASAQTARERNQIRANREGSADKYARMTASWLQRLGLVEQVAKTVSVQIAGKEYSESINHAYMITNAGLMVLNRTVGKSRHKRVPKNVSFEMMATKGSDREYLRTRRSYILKFIVESRRRISFDEIKNSLSVVGLDEKLETIKDDVRGLQNIGLRIATTDLDCRWEDLIYDFTLPLPQAVAKSDLTAIKEDVRSQLQYLSHNYLSMIDLAYDSRQYALFEIKTLELLTEECKYSGVHMGGSRKPDGIIYTADSGDSYGVIIDTKAYKNGYSLPIGQADEMERYIRENQKRSARLNPNKWWLEFGDNIERYFFMFVAGHFIGGYAAQLERISHSTQTDGAAVGIKNLLLCAEAIKSGALLLRDVPSIMFRNQEYICATNLSSRGIPL